MLTAGVLNDGQANSLLSKLEDAVQLLEDGKVTPAVHKLEDFISEVSNFIDNGTLTSAQGQPLIDAAEEVLDLLLNDPLVAGVDAVFSEFDLLEELLGV